MSLGGTSVSERANSATAGSSVRLRGSEVANPAKNVLFVGVRSEAVRYGSDEGSWAFSLSSAVRYAADVDDDFGAGNLEDLGRAPGIERMREVVLEPVDISVIGPRHEGVRGVAYNRLVSLVWLDYTIQYQ